MFDLSQGLSDLTQDKLYLKSLDLDNLQFFYVLDPSCSSDQKFSQGFTPAMPGQLPERRGHGEGRGLVSTDKFFMRSLFLTAILGVVLLAKSSEPRQKGSH
jgi:hypothetical protein